MSGITGGTLKYTDAGATENCIYTVLEITGSGILNAVFFYGSCTVKLVIDDVIVIPNTTDGTQGATVVDCGFPLLKRFNTNCKIYSGTSTLKHRVSYTLD